MPRIDGFIHELTQEGALTRRVLEVVPEEHFDWKPHERSMTLGVLASHIVDTIGWVPTTLDLDIFQMDSGSYQPFKASTQTALLGGFDQKMEEALGSMRGRSDACLLGIWKMTAGGRTVLEMPRISLLRVFILNHQIHHRGQLDVYLRLKDVPLPQIYGPTSDDPRMIGRV